MVNSEEEKAYKEYIDDTSSELIEERKDTDKSIDTQDTNESKDSETTEEKVETGIIDETIYTRYNPVPIGPFIKNDPETGMPDIDAVQHANINYNIPMEWPDQFNESLEYYSKKTVADVANVELAFEDYVSMLKDDIIDTNRDHEILKSTLDEYKKELAKYKRENAQMNEEFKNYNEAAVGLSELGDIVKGHIEKLNREQAMYKDDLRDIIEEQNKAHAEQLYNINLKNIQLVSTIEQTCDLISSFGDSKNNRKLLGVLDSMRPLKNR
ncbi:MAG: hypothetical protein K8S00_04320 [Bacteroidales bacterium]|nr:hypothetical protein [Bacteroidales bacterium]